MNRRSFMSLIFVAIWFSAARALGFLRNGRKKNSELSGAQSRNPFDHQITVAPGGIVRLPSNPRPNQEIAFVYKHQGAKHAKIFSVAHPVCHQWAPLHLDQSALFNLNFDEKVGEWYLINLGAFVPEASTSALSIG